MSIDEKRQPKRRDPASIVGLTIPPETDTLKFADEARLKSVWVQVYTPKEPDNGGTDSDVFLYIGDHQFELDNDKNNFEKGVLDEFQLDLNATLGELRGARIVLSCPDGGWFCGWIAVNVVFEKQTVARGYKRFEVNGWLDDDEATTIRVLQEPTPSNLLQQYRHPKR